MRRWRTTARIVGGLAVLGVAIACDPPPSTPATDAGADAAVPDPLARDAGALPPLDLLEPAPPAPAATPAPPALGPCADGWDAVDGACLPAIDRAPDCAPEEHAFATGCRRVGSPCAADGWPVDVPAGRPAVYVSPEGRFDGAGTREDPLSSTATALARLAGDGVMVLAAGVYREVGLTIDGDVEVLGACSEATRIESILSQRDRILVELRDRGALRDVTVASRGVPIVAAEATTSARLDGVIVEGGHGAGLLVSRSATATVDDVVVRGIVPLDLWGDASTGLYADRGGTIHARRVLVEALDGTAVVVGDGSRLDGGDLTLRDTREGVTSRFASGLTATGGAEVTLVDSLVERHPGAGIVADGAGVRVTLDRVLVRDVVGLASGERGEAVAVERGAHVAMRRSSLAGSRSAGIVVNGATLEATDGRVADTLASRAFGWGGQGVFVGDGATATLERIVIDRPRSAGLETQWSSTARLIATDVTVRGARRAPVGHSGAGIACGLGTRCTLDRILVEDAEGTGIDIGGTVDGRDLVVRDVRVVPRGGPGHGIHVMGEAVATLERVEVTRASSEAIKVWGGGRATIADAVLRDTQPDRFLLLGDGVWVTDGSHLELSRALIEDMRFAGILVDGRHPDDPGVASDLIASDVLVRRVAGDDLVGFFGNGVRTSGGTRTILRRVRVEAAREAAVVAFGGGTLIDGEDVTIEGTRMRACTERDVDRCATDISGGCGITAFDDGAISLYRFRSTDNDLCGVMIAPRSSITLAEGEIARNPIGANVQVPDYDLSRLSDDVRYVDNDRNYDGAALPVPDDAPPRF